MAIQKLFNLARVTTTTVGTGTMNLGSAVPGFLTFDDSGVQNGDVVSYGIRDGTGSEVGRGTYNSSGSTLSRDTIIKSTNANAAIPLTGAGAEVFITPLAEDFDVAGNLAAGFWTPSDIASAATCSIGTATTPYVRITGTTTITSLGSDASKLRFVEFTGALTLTYNGTSLILPGAGNIITRAGDKGIFVSDASGNWRCLAWTPVGYIPREILIGSRTYYVRTDGSNSNNGLANTSGGAFLTIQKAVDTVAALDTNGKIVTIQCGAGTYTGSVVLPYVIGAKVATLQIIGDTTTPSNCIINPTSVFAAIQSAGCGNGWYVRGFKITTTTTGYCVYVGDQLSTISLGENEYGAVPSGYSHIASRYGGRVQTQTGYTISGNANSHLLTNEAGILTVASGTVTLSGTPAFSAAFAQAYGLSAIEFGSVTWSGSATGSRYASSQNSFINTFGQATTWLPGSTAGSTSTGGLYA